MAEKNKKSLLEEALEEITQLKEGMDINTKEILRSIAKEEINGKVNESLNEDFGDEEDNETEEVGAEIEMDADTDSEEVIGADSEMEAELGSEDEVAATDDFSSEEDNASYEAEEGTDDYEYDFTNASDDEIISVFKKLSGTDEIEIVNDNEVNIKDPESGNEYQVKLNNKPSTEEAPIELGADTETEVPMDLGTDAETEAPIDLGAEEEEEVEYEVSLDDEEEVEEGVNEDIVRGPGHDTYVTDASLPTGDIEGTKADTKEAGDEFGDGFDDDAVKHADAEGPMVMEDEEIGEIEESEEELDESIPVGNAQARRVPGKNTPIKGAGARSLAESKEYKQLKADYASLIKENEGFKTALKEFRGMLQEVGKYNANLTYATRIFTEHSTTQDEKKQILSRFDNEATSLTESKKVYKSIVSDLNKKTTISESVGNKINADTKTSGHSNINESTAYEDESTRRMKELMRKVSRR